MHLNMHHYPVQSISWGGSTGYSNGQLTINREELLAHLQDKGELRELEITDLVLVSPDTPSRVINIFDIFPACARLDKGAIDYPGILGPLQSVGHGDTAMLENMAVLAISSKPSIYNKVLDMSGAGSVLTPYAGFHHLAVCVEPKRPEMTIAEYYGCLKKIGLRIGSYLARAAADSSPSAQTIKYTLEPRPERLPKVAYVCMVTSHQKSEKGEPILYGDDIAGLLPTILHPNEMLDGAVISPYWNLGIDTYSYQMNPVVKGLYQRHGIDFDFAGVVLCVSHITRQQRERSVMMISNLVRSVLGADMAIISKVGGGIPESDLMMTVESLELRGVRTSAVIWSHCGDGSVKDSLSATSIAADALASAGIYDDWVDLPEQMEVIGGSSFGSDANEEAKPATSAIRVRYRDICGCISQMGASRVAQVEI